VDVSSDVVVDGVRGTDGIEQEISVRRMREIGGKYQAVAVAFQDEETGLGEVDLIVRNEGTFSESDLALQVPRYPLDPLLAAEANLSIRMPRSSHQAVQTHRKNTWTPHRHLLLSLMGPLLWVGFLALRRVEMTIPALQWYTVEEGLLDLARVGWPRTLEWHRSRLTIEKRNSDMNPVDMDFPSQLIRSSCCYPPTSAAREDIVEDKTLSLHRLEEFQSRTPLEREQIHSVTHLTRPLWWAYFPSVELRVMRHSLRPRNQLLR